jgi:hypothetical protein
MRGTQVVLMSGGHRTLMESRIDYWKKESRIALRKVLENLSDLIV